MHPHMRYQATTVRLIQLEQTHLCVHVMKKNSCLPRAHSCDESCCQLAVAMPPIQCKQTTRFQLATNLARLLVEGYCSPATYVAH